MMEDKSGKVFVACALGAGAGFMTTTELSVYLGLWSYLIGAVTSILVGYLSMSLKRSG